MHDLPSADRDYEAFRREYERRIDDDYVAWRRQRFGAGFEAWRRERQRAAANDSGGTGVERSQAGPPTSSVGMGGVPASADERLSPSMSGGDAPHDESPLQSLGRAVSETVIGAPR
jgi:hypothetical protein